VSKNRRESRPPVGDGTEQPRKRPGPVKAYRNQDFINSPDGRVIRMIAEYQEPLQRFRRNKIKDTIVIFGSARAQSPEHVEEDNARGGSRELDRYYEDARQLTYLLTKWSKGLEGGGRRFTVCSGGGPGIMEAANRGASEADGETIGLGISIPFEQSGNPYISHKLNFEFHYFFIRKFWFVYLAKAFVVFPGGFGTMDELFEILTLVQTKKVTKALPIVLYGSEYWNEVINIDAMARYGTISPEDRDLIKVLDNPEETFDYLSTELSRLYLGRRGKAGGHW
jgi:uncharacterized protein (TIGR00730 family)